MERSRSAGDRTQACAVTLEAPLKPQEENFKFTEGCPVAREQTGTGRELSGRVHHCICKWPRETERRGNKLCGVCCCCLFLSHTQRSPGLTPGWTQGSLGGKGPPWRATWGARESPRTGCWQGQLPTHCTRSTDSRGQELAQMTSVQAFSAGRRLRLDPKPCQELSPNRKDSNLVAYYLENLKQVSVLRFFYLFNNNNKTHLIIALKIK